MHQAFDCSPALLQSSMHSSACADPKAVAPVTLGPGILRSAVALGMHAAAQLFLCMGSMQLISPAGLVPPEIERKQACLHLLQWSRCLRSLKEVLHCLSLAQRDGRDHCMCRQCRHQAHRVFYPCCHCEALLERTCLGPDHACRLGACRSPASAHRGATAQKRPG